MPYTIIKVKNGYFIAKQSDHDKVFSNKPHKTKNKAIKQMQAIILNENRGNNVKGGLFPFYSLAQTAYNLIPIRKDYSSRIKTLLKQYGNISINKLTVMRKPIQGFVNTTLNAASLGQWQKAVKDSGYDNVFHLYIVVNLTNGINLVVEKNEIINVKVATSDDLSPSNGQSMEVPNLLQGLTIIVMLQKTKDSMGSDRYWTYNAFTNNCQTFIKYLLDANGLITPQLLSFIDQNVASIASSSLSSPVKAIANFTTTLASKLRTITGRGIQLF